MAAYVQKKRTWPDGEEVLLPGMVLLWDVMEAQVNVSSAYSCFGVCRYCKFSVLLWRRSNTSDNIRNGA